MAVFSYRIYSASVQIYVQKRHSMTNLKVGGFNHIGVNITFIITLASIMLNFAFIFYLNNAVLYILVTSLTPLSLFASTFAPISSAQVPFNLHITV